MAGAALLPEVRAAKATRNAGQARSQADRSRSQVLGILILAGLMLLYACLRYCLRLA